MNIGRNIKALRKKKGLSQAELGLKLGVSQKVISAYERSYRLPPSSLIPHVAESLGTSTDALYQVSGDEGRAQKLKNSELWTIVERLEEIPESERKKVFKFIDKYLADRGV